MAPAFRPSVIIMQRLVSDQTSAPLMTFLLRVPVADHRGLVTEHNSDLRDFSVYKQKQVGVGRIFKRPYSRRFDLVETRLMEACSIHSLLWFCSAHPTYFETMCVHSDVAQIWVVGDTGEGTLSGPGLWSHLGPEPDKSRPAATSHFSFIPRAWGMVQMLNITFAPLYFH